MNCIKGLILFWECCLQATENLHMNVYITVVFVKDEMNRKQVKDYRLLDKILCDYVANEYFNSLKFMLKTFDDVSISLTIVG